MHIPSLLAAVAFSAAIKAVGVSSIQRIWPANVSCLSPTIWTRSETKIPKHAPTAPAL